MLRRQCETADGPNMKRQRIKQAQTYDDYRDVQNDSDEFERSIPLQNQRIRRDNVLEAQVQPGDTLQAIALRCNCTISDIKRLNKIEKETEIHARKTIKVPANAYSVLLNTNDDLPTVHTSGQNSPKFMQNYNGASNSVLLTNNQTQLDEKLLVASVTLASAAGPSPADNINDIILNSELAQKESSGVSGFILNDLIDGDDENSTHLPLLDSNELSLGGPHSIRGAPRPELSCNGSDCDISWICLFVFILALCFAIPLVYIFYIAEHPEKFHH